MKVLLKRNVPKLGRIGDVVEVKQGYARNYLLPQGIATNPTAGNLKAIEAEKQLYLEELAKQREQFEARAKAIDGREVTIAARANPEGHLYGSVGPAQIVSALANEGVFVEADTVVMNEPIRKLDKYDVTIQLAEEITATVKVWVVPVHAEGAAEADETDDAAEDDES